VPVLTTELGINRWLKWHHGSIGQLINCEGLFFGLAVTKFMVVNDLLLGPGSPDLLSSAVSVS
jgi:hypothetical protein